MGLLNTRNKLLEQVISVSPVPVAYENNDFDPSGLDAFVAFYFVPVTSESLGKTVQSSDDDRGYIQLSIFVRSNADDFDNQLFQLLDTFKANFYNGLMINDVMILEVVSNGASRDDAWYKRDLTINYTVFNQRV